MEPDLECIPLHTVGRLGLVGQLQQCRKEPGQPLVTRGRENPGVEPVQSGLLTDAFSITGESSPESDKKCTMEVLCNLFFFLCRVNQYQGAKTKD